VLTVALPPARVPVPIVARPSLNVAVPVGVPAPGAVAATVAVKVTDWPYTEGFALELRVVVVSALFTVWVSTALVLALKPEAPEYSAVIECVPTVSPDVLKLAWPALSVPVPSVVVPSLKVMVPVGVAVPLVGVTVAVKVTDWPCFDGFALETTVVVVLTVLRARLNDSEAVPPLPFPGVPAGVVNV